MGDRLTMLESYASEQAMEPHPHRAALLAEAHARPFHPIRTPRRLLHFAFLTDADQAIAARTALAAYCRTRGVAEPRPSVKHIRIKCDDIGLLWEQHNEFTTYTWDIDPDDPEVAGRSRWRWMRGLAQAGPLLVQIELNLLQCAEVQLAQRFNASSLALSAMDVGAALAATDFRADEAGFVRVAVADISLTPSRAGALAQRLLELETYRVSRL